MIKKKLTYGKSNGWREGIGTIIAATFIVLIIVSGYALTTVLNMRTKELNEVIGEMNMFDWERGKERIEIVGNPFNVDDTLNLTVENTGEIKMHLRWMIIRNTSNLKPILDYTRINVYVRPGEVVTGLGKDINQERNDP